MISLEPFLFSSPMKFRYYFTIAKLAVIIFTPVVLMFLPADFFDNGSQSLCISRLLFDQECPACGMTRACQHLIHFDFEDAFAYNMMSFIALPFLGVVWIKWGLKENKTLKAINKKRAEISGLKAQM